MAVSSCSTALFIRAYQQCNSKGGQDRHHHSRGGLTTKIHALVEKLPILLGLSNGQAHDAPATLLGDQAYAAGAIFSLVEEHGAVPNIAPMSQT
ncbi:MAG: hypothetical protein NVSMB6_20830 [Burkholderiaceae bacterium]